MKIREINLNIFGTELKIKLSAIKKITDKHPGKLVVDSFRSFFNPEIQPKKIKHINEL